jgi:hypothetical protein
MSEVVHQDNYETILHYRRSLKATSGASLDRPLGYRSYNLNNKFAGNVQFII